MGSSLLQTPLAGIQDPSLLAFIRELEGACGVPLSRHGSLWLYHYVWQCVYPQGASEKRFPIHKDRIVPGGLLDSKIGKLAGTAVYQFCHDLAMSLQSQSAELVENMKLYVFLNRYLPALKK
jgi:hypothetical protein